jgi:hypothetical protein
MGREDLPSKEVVVWAGMGMNDPVVPDSKKVYGQSHRLSSLNDTAKLTFPEIAKVIRKHWKEL